MKNNISSLQAARMEYKPKLPHILSKGIKNLSISMGEATESLSDQAQIKQIFQNTYGMPIVTFKAGKNKKKVFTAKNVGIILSGGQAPGGHNVIAGVFDALKQANPNSKLYGFLGGSSGIIDGKYIEITAELLENYRNTGGFDLIGSGRTKLETEEQFMKAWNTCQNMNISAVIMIGGDDSNTNAAMLAEWFAGKNAGIQVIGCPKTIDGDLKNDQIEISFGFDTATKTYAELIGNIQRDAVSARKYWHFIKLMGRNASHVALEVALQTHPNMTFISEEIAAEKASLSSIVDYMANIVAKRAANGKNFGTALIPEGLIEFVPEMKSLISNINDAFSLLNDDNEYKTAQTDEVRFAIIEKTLAKTNPADADVFRSLPTMIKAQLLLDRDPHGNVQVSKIETERLLVEMLKTRLDEMKAKGEYDGKFSYQGHFFGYEGRCAFPSNFDADYCYSLGFNAFALIEAGLTGYISSIKQLTKGADKWIAGGVPLTMMMNMEKRHGQFKPVIQKALVDLNGSVFKYLVQHREEWALNESYLYPGAIQYFGPAEVTDKTTITLALEKNNGAVYTRQTGLRHPISSLKAFLAKHPNWFRKKTFK